MDVSGQLQALPTLTPRKEPPVPIGQGPTTSWVATEKRTFILNRFIITLYLALNDSVIMNWELLERSLGPGFMYHTNMCLEEVRKIMTILTLYNRLEIQTRKQSSTVTHYIATFHNQDM
jgi:hypothetical protein